MTWNGVNLIQYAPELNHLYLFQALYGCIEQAP